ncbi:MAG: hypothetical protein AAGL23_04875 [Pseudomonadota bacterium]
MMYFTKRTFCMGFFSGIAVPNALIANPEGGSGRGVAPRDEIPGRILANGQREVTYDQLTRIVDWHVFWLKEARRKGKLVVPGFSGPMLQWLLFGMSRELKRTQRLMRRMRRLTDNAERRAELENEAAEVRRILRGLQASVDALAPKRRAGEELTENEDNLLIDDLYRIRLLTDYLEFVDTWVKFPHEGNRSG